MAQLKYLRHPFQTASSAKTLFAACWSMWRLANHGAVAYFGGEIKVVHRRFYLSHVLYPFDELNEQTKAAITLRDSGWSWDR
jgi:hypothetical protein